MEKAGYRERLIGVTQIWDRLFLSALCDAERIARANPHGITTVVSLSETPPRTRHRGILYVYLPIEDEQALPVGHFNAIIAAIAEHIRRGKVLVHCGSGISRAPVVVAAYLHAVGYKPFDAALKMIAELRPIVAPSAVLLASVRELLR